MTVNPALRLWRRRYRHPRLRWITMWDNPVVCFVRLILGADHSPRAVKRNSRMFPSNSNREDSVRHLRQ